MEKQSRRLAEIGRRRAEGAVRPGKRETGMKVAVLSESSREVRVKLDLRIRSNYRSGESEHCEERWERQSVTLKRGTDGVWHVVRVEEHADERRTEADGLFWTAPFEPEIPAAAGKRAGVPSRPLLHPRAAGAMSLSLKPRPYDREAARQYADEYWNKRNPAYESFEVNCTNYISQCLFAGGVPMNYTGKRESGWWYAGKSGGKEAWSYSWAVAHSLQLYLLNSPTGLRGTAVSSSAELDIGDVIFYDWDGNGRFQHSVIVTDRDGSGQPLVNANTADSRRRYWDYRDSPAWTERTRYRFVRIESEF
ncbi:amidase domain-containing protein [Paenibacillus thermoaerophilus]|uniref:Amidase domain-containing protein n=1 Tax=Paenibacillus thermoaerophilus TaxID=1215385 RepID=A0ABW2UZW9_9BACL|nr:amidase domain-containing protein [Paenibacillus thermoaerophilus]